MERVITDPTDPTEVQVLYARVVELETEVASLRQRHEALETLADRIIAFLKSMHGDDSDAFRLVEEAAQEAIRSR
jgi:hypothetical protein